MKAKRRWRKDPERPELSRFIDESDGTVLGEVEKVGPGRWAWSVNVTVTVWDNGPTGSLYHGDGSVVNTRAEAQNAVEHEAVSIDRAMTEPRRTY